jgi:hypothetical protein
MEHDIGNSYKMHLIVLSLQLDHKLDSRRTLVRLSTSGIHIYISSLRDPGRHWFSPSLVFNEYRRLFRGVTPPEAWGWLFNSGADVRNECSYTTTPSIHLHGMHKHKYTILDKTIVYMDILKTHEIYRRLNTNNFTLLKFTGYLMPQHI